MVRLLRLSGTSGRALDLGCGTGSMAAHLATLGFSVWALDPSLGCTELTRRMADARGLSRQVRVVAARGEDLPLPDKYFDVAMCGEVLEHVENDRRAVGEIARVLRPGGAFIVTVPADEWRFDSCDQWAGHRRRYSEETLRELCQSAGLRVIWLQRWGFPLGTLYDRLVFKPYVRRLPRMERTGAGSTGGLTLGGVLHALGRTPGIAWAVAQSFRVDDLFAGLGRGSSILLLAQRS